jgi:hypothetical protein
MQNASTLVNTFQQKKILFKLGHIHDYQNSKYSSFWGKGFKNLYLKKKIGIYF